MTTISVGGVSIEIEMLDTQRTRHVGPRIVESLPIDLAHWPIDAAEIERRAQETFRQFQCREDDRQDAEWAVGKAGMEYMEITNRYYFCAVPTLEQRVKMRAAAREEARDGLV